MCFACKLLCYIYFSLPSSTLVFKDNIFHFGPNTPEHLENHCVAAINETHSFVAGGSFNVDWAETTERKAWIYDWENNKWTRIENMITSAYHDTYCYTIGREVIGND